MRFNRIAAVRSDDVIADRYRLVKVVGSGDRGIAWLANDLREHRQVALRRPHTASDLERAADIAKLVEHPRAVKVFDVVGDGDDRWLVMEYFPATSLADKGVLPPREVAAIGAQVAGALAAAHEADVVHQDVTPDTILVNDKGVAKVTDFGISTVSSSTAYVSPEVADGNDATAASDVFSLGATLFAAVEGQPPFGAGDPDAVLSRIRSGRGEIATRAGALKPVLDALLRRDVASRPTAAQAKSMLDRVASGQTVPPWPGAKRQPKALLVTAAAAIVVLALVRPWESEAGGPARTVLGDPRTADPCSVADAQVLGRFGEATLKANYGGFNRCDVLIAVAGDDEIDVEFGFGGPRADAPTTSGTPDVVRHPPKRDGEDCGIGLTLADRSVLEIAARSDDDIDTDFCQVAAVAADHAQSVMRQHHEIPRRPKVDPRSLATVDACGLITPTDLAAEPAYTGIAPTPGFARWSCRWQSPAGDVQVIFDRTDADSPREGTRVAIAGRQVYVVPAGYGEFTCAARIFHLRHQDDNGDAYVELALVVVAGGAAMPELCRVASTFATPVAEHLPQL
jgi:hypothetical protein